ncbi:hypothetical protein AO498_15420 [Algoriphagus sanaruensis]|uniref:Uncharacterized protein n=1 Tax=Algoriphagus sanaruensis TaxID=1727163 RepID=A0A142ERT8_9BACT|nr:hypothetical protein AO498_15420 [Algoriphagus sanaruensis]
MGVYVLPVGWVDAKFSVAKVKLLTLKSGEQACFSESRANFLKDFEVYLGNITRIERFLLDALNFAPKLNDSNVQFL